MLEVFIWLSKRSCCRIWCSRSGGGLVVAYIEDMTVWCGCLVVWCVGVVSRSSGVALVVSRCGGGGLGLWVWCWCLCGHCVRSGGGMMYGSWWC